MHLLELQGIQSAQATYFESLIKKDLNLHPQGSGQWADSNPKIIETAAERDESD